MTIKNLPQSRKLRIGLISFVIFVLFSAHSWIWGVMDDALLASMIKESVSGHGLIRGIIHNFSDFMLHDRSWGLFRPAYWLYASTVYLLPPNFAFGLRFVMFFLMMVWSAEITSFSLKKGGATLLIFVLLLALLSNRSLYEGLSAVTLQEFTGLFFSLLGFRLGFCNNSPSLFSRVALTSSFFWIAACFKIPFIGLAFAYAFTLLIKKKLWSGLFVFFVSTILLVVSLQWARSGVYTNAIVQVNFQTLSSTLVHFLKYFSAPGLILLSILIFVSFSKTRISFSQNCIPFVFIFAGLFYLGMLLPRGVGPGFGYYLSPPIFFLTMGFLLLIFLKLDFLSLHMRSSQACLFIALSIATVVGSYSVSKLIYRNQTLNQVKDWLLKQSSSGITLAVNSEEAATWISRIMLMANSRQWTNKVLFLDHGHELKQRIDYYIVFTEQAKPNENAMHQPVEVFALARIYKL